MRLGHPSSRVFDNIAKDCKLSFKENGRLFVCEACQLGKSHALPFKHSESHASKPFDLIHTDVWGPASIDSTDGYRYYVQFLDDHSRYVWIYPLTLKSDTLPTFQHFLTYVQTQFGGEYTRIHGLCSQLGIRTRLSCPYTSSQNGRAERKHRHIVETSLALLAHASMSFQFWWDAFCTAADLINQLPASTLHGKSPMQTLFHKSADISSLRVFGCACYPCLCPYQSHKF